MGAGRKTQTFMFNGSSPPTQHPETITACSRSLRKSQLGGVIFGCKNNTLKECLFKQIFGLPAQHFSFVKNIDPGLPLFLFNYSDRKLHGIFEAASPGQMNINPYGWTKDGSEKTLYPAQIQIRVRLQCQPLHEEQFRPIIADNYHTPNHFWFELDHAQASRLISKLSSLAVALSTYLPQNTAKWRKLFRPLPSPAGREVAEGPNPSDSEVVLSKSDQSSMNSGSSAGAPCTNGDDKPLEDHSHEQVVQEDEDLIYLKLKELALNREHLNTSSMGYVDDTVVTIDLKLDGKCHIEEHVETDHKNEEIPIFSSDGQSIIARLIREVEELKAFKAAEIRKTGYLEQRLVEAEEEIQQLKEHCMMLESRSSSSIVRVDETVIESFDELQLDSSESIHLERGYDGISWLSALDAYSPSHYVIKMLRPMSSVQSFASVAKLNAVLYIFGGGNGDLWYDIVESCNPATDQRTPNPSLNGKKGSLSGVTLDGKIFSVGGGNGAECFADVVMFDVDIGQWISTQSVLQKRFALAAAEPNGVLYATGGHDGKDYLNSTQVRKLVSFFFLVSEKNRNLLRRKTSEILPICYAERFDHREHSWTRIESMKTKRGCHSLVAPNEVKRKLIADVGTILQSKLAIPRTRFFYKLYDDTTVGRPNSKL